VRKRKNDEKKEKKGEKMKEKKVEKKRLVVKDNRENKTFQNEFFSA
jgi:hypothetical protein